MCKKLQKIALFSRKLLKIGGFERFYPNSWDIYGTLHGFGNAQKLHFFSRFFRKMAENRGNKHFLGNFMANNGRYTAGTFEMDLHKNCTFFGNSNTNAL